MKEFKSRNGAITIFMMAIIVMTFFFPLFNIKKKYKAYPLRQEITRSSSDSSRENNNKRSSPGFVNLIEEEIEYALETKKEYLILLPIRIIKSSSSPSLFFKEHFAEVSGPPPWA